MAEHDDAADEVLERLEFTDDRDERKAQQRWRQLTRRTALSGGAAGLATLILQACGGGGNDNTGSTSTAAAQGTPASGIFGTSGKPKFTLVSVTGL